MIKAVKQTFYKKGNVISRINDCVHAIHQQIAEAHNSGVEGSKSLEDFFIILMHIDKLIHII